MGGHRGGHKRGHQGDIGGDMGEHRGDIGGHRRGPRGPLAIFNCFIPLESSQSPLFISGCFSSILLIKWKESKETAWLYSTVYAFRLKESKDTKIQPEMNRGD